MAFLFRNLGVFIIWIAHNEPGCNIGCQYLQIILEYNYELGYW